MVNARACGKTILIGEHGVVYGARAIAIPLKQVNLQLSISVSTSTGDSENRTHSIQLGAHDSSEEIFALVRQAQKLLDIEALNLDIKGHSSIPLGAGLGSSAALCVAMLRALRNLSPNKDKIMKNEDLASYANTLEAIFHGNPSGLDVSVVTHEACLLFRKGEKPEPIAFSSGQGDECLNFVLIDSLMRASTKHMVEIAKPFFMKKMTQSYAYRFDELSSCALSALKATNSEALAPILQEAGDLLEEIGVSNETLEAMREFVREQGTLASKITGAGGGGMLLVLLHPGKKEEQLKQIKSAYGEHRVWEFCLP